MYPAARIDAALSNYFRLGNLTALRELALLWLADEVDSALKAYRAEHGIDSKWEARERVVVALTGGPEGETLIRRGARIAARSAGGELIVVHVSRQDGLADAHPGALAAQRALAGEARRQLPPGDRRRCAARPGRLREGDERHPARDRRQPTRRDRRSPDGPRHRRHGHPRIRRHRRAHRHALPRGRHVHAAPRRRRSDARSAGSSASPCRSCSGRW